MTVETILQALCAALMALTGLLYAYQAVYLLVPLFKKEMPHTAGKQLRYGVLIAARNEEAVLPHLLSSIRAQDYPAELVDTYVVADNCTDRTAEAAEAGGARVFRRFSKMRVGKGYALHDLLEQIPRERYDAFLVFDADNLLEPDFITRINRVADRGYAAFCGCRHSKNFGDNWLSAGYGVLFLHESVHLNRARMLLGTSCAVSGTGFGFTRELLERIGGWNFFTLTEDIEFGTWCATHGERIGYSHDAVFYDEQPTSFAVSVRQRTRWIQGGIQVSLRRSGDYLRGMLRGGRTGWASFEMATLSLWGYGMSALSGGAALLVTFLTERWLGLGLALATGLFSAWCSLFLVGALTVLAERRRIRATRAELGRAVLAFPAFMLTFLPIAALALFRKFEWAPIAHHVAIPAAGLPGKRGG